MHGDIIHGVADGGKRVVAALYIETGGVYTTMPSVDPWDIARDARLYSGPWPVVAHPPCPQWSRLRHLRHVKRDSDIKALAPLAVEQVRRWGGVLEHPAESDLWRHCRLPWPFDPCVPAMFPMRDEWGGFSVVVDQARWGHRARKRTWLYIVGIEPGQLPDIPPARAWEPNAVNDTLGKRARRATPPAFAEWLVEVAGRVGGKRAWQQLGMAMVSTVECPDCDDGTIGGLVCARCGGEGEVAGTQVADRENIDNTATE